MELIKIDHNIDLEPDSIAEGYFVSTIMPVCNDNVACQLGDTFGRSFNRYVISHKDYKRVKPLIDHMAGREPEEDGLKWYHIAGGVAILALGGTLLYLKGGRKRAAKRECWADFNGLIVKDEDVTDFVLKHLRPIDKLDPYAITNATLWTHGIYEGFGGDVKVPEGNWKFFTKSFKEV